jgi:hypothetical protein
VAGVTRRRQWQRNGDGDGGAATAEAVVSAAIWESLKALREADGAATMRTNVDVIIGALGMENEMIEGTINEGVV